MSIHGHAQAIEEEAARWISRRMGSIASSEQDHEFASWLAASTAHKIAYLRLESAWRHAERLKELRSTTEVSNRLVDSSEAARVHAAHQINGRVAVVVGKRQWFWALAASLIIVSSAWMLFKPAGTSYSTVAGQTQPLSLSDGTLVTMDTQTQLKIDDNSRHRAIHLYKGAALFKVVHDNSRPFSVNIGDFEFTDIGTRFIVRLDGGETRLAVLEGSVRIQQMGLFNSASRREIPAGTSVIIRKDQINVSALSNDEASRLVSWVDGYIEFKDVRLADAVREFNRYHAEQLIINDPRLDDVRLGGRFKYADLTGFLTQLQRAFGITAISEGEHIKLSLP